MKDRTSSAQPKDPEEYRRMRTRWGRRRGWEIQRLSVKIGGKPFYRLSWRAGGCREATSVELALWRALPKEQRT